MTTTNITNIDQVQEIRKNFAAYEFARKTYDPKGYENGRTYDSRQRAEITRLAGVSMPTDSELSAVEVWEFANMPPKALFAYVDKATSTMRTFNGDVLGSVTFGKEHKSPGFNGAFSKRVPIKVTGINGLTYYGTWYKSAGTYARLKVCSKHLKNTQK